MNSLVPYRDVKARKNGHAAHIVTARKVTRQEFACGSCEIRELISDDGYSDTTRTLWRDHNNFHIREHNSATGRVFWLSCDTLTEARAMFNRRFPCPIVPFVEGDAQ